MLQKLGLFAWAPRLAQTFVRGIQTDTSQLVKRLQFLSPAIHEGHEHKDIQWLSRSRRVFKLDSTPSLVFKTTNSQQDASTYLSNNQTVGNVCRTIGLSHLIVPQARKIEFHDGNAIRILIAEECLAVEHSVAKQINDYFTSAQNMSVAARQLALIIKYSGLFNITPKNMPLLKREPDSKITDRQVCLIDTRFMHEDSIGVLNGFCGTPNGSDPGLIRCLGSEELIDDVINVAMEGVEIPNFRDQLYRAKTNRMKEISAYHELKKRYTRLGIAGKEPLRVDVKKLELPLQETDKRLTSVFITRSVTYNTEEVTLGELAQSLINKINEGIAKAPEDTTTQLKRKVILRFNTEDLMLGLPQDDKRRIPLSELPLENLWVYKILQALVVNGDIHSFTKHDIDQFEVQA